MLNQGTGRLRECGVVSICYQTNTDWTSKICIDLLGCDLKKVTMALRLGTSA
jgi:hypothetical protein